MQALESTKRYLGRIWYQWQTVSVLIVLAMAEGLTIPFLHNIRIEPLIPMPLLPTVVLLLRIWALYGQSKRIILFTGSLFVAFVCGGISLVYLSIVNVDGRSRCEA